MKETKLWQLIQSLSDKEKLSFRIFIQMPLVNREQYVCALYDLLWQHPGELPDNLSIFQALYPGEAHRDSRIRYLKSQLFALLKRFIYAQKPDCMFEEIGVFRHLREKGLQHLYQKEENRIWGDIRHTPPDNSREHLLRYFLAFEWHNHHVKTNRIATEYLDQLNLNLDLFFIIEKLKLACTAFNLKRLYKVQAETTLIEPILAHIESNNLQHAYPLLGIYASACQMLATQDSRHYFLLKSYLMADEPQYPADEIKDAFLLALNFCIQEINKGQVDFYKEALLLYQKGFQKLILLENGYLNPITYSNAITLALRSRDFESAWQFIQNYKGSLHGAEQEEYYFFNLSKYYFETGNFDKVIELYYQSNLKELLVHIQVRIIQIKAFYEKGEYSLCQNLNDNLQQLLSRKGILAYHKENYVNISKAFNRLLSLNRYDKQARQRFLDKLNGVSPLTEKSWLMEKMA